MGLTRAEQETTIRWDDEEQTVHIWSASPTTWRKMARLGVAPARETTRHGRPSGRFYVLPLAAFRWGLKRPRPLGRPGGNPAALARFRQRKQQGASPDPEHPGISPRSAQVQGVP